VLLVEADIIQRRQSRHLLALDKMCATGLVRLPLQRRRLLSGGLGGLGNGVIFLDPFQEVESARGVLDVLYPDVDPLLHDPGPHLLVQLDTDGTRRHVPHDTRLAVVELVRHTFVDSTITGDVDDLAELVGFEEGLRGQGTGAAPLLGEEVARVRAVTERVGHSVCAVSPTD